MNIAQVKAKARTAMRRREDEIEQEEIEGGEINLVPYLDIVTNLMLFMLATVSAGFILGQINTTLPEHAPAGAVKPTDPTEKPDEQPLQLVVSVTGKRILLWSISGLEGTLAEPKLQVPAAVKTAPDDAPSYDYHQLNTALVEIASRRYKGKVRPLDTYEIILQVDGDIPYETVIDTMDVLRRQIPKGSKPGDDLPKVGMPKTEQKGDEIVPVEEYDPEKHYLFNDILFAKPSFE